MNDDEARRRFAEARVARLATVDADGRPHLVPICFAVVGDDRLVSTVDHKPKRTRQLKRLVNIAVNPAVEVLVDHYDDDWATLWWVRVVGRAQVITDVDEQQRALERLVAKYAQYRRSRPSGPVIAVDVDAIRHWEATPR